MSNITCVLTHTHTHTHTHTDTHAHTLTHTHTFSLIHTHNTHTHTHTNTDTRAHTHTHILTDTHTHTHTHTHTLSLSLAHHIQTQVIDQLNVSAVVEAFEKKFSQTLLMGQSLDDIFGGESHYDSLRTVSSLHGNLALSVYIGDVCSSLKPR